MLATCDTLACLTGSDLGLEVAADPHVPFKERWHFYARVPDLQE